VSTVSFNTSEDGSPGSGFDSRTWAEATTEDEVSAGSTTTIGGWDDGGSSQSMAGATVRMVYDSPDSDSSSTLGKFEVPDN